MLGGSATGTIHSGNWAGRSGSSPRVDQPCHSISEIMTAPKTHSAGSRRRTRLFTAATGERCNEPAMSDPPMANITPMAGYA